MKPKMKSSHLLTFLTASSVATAAWQKLMPGLAGEELLARQWDDAGCSSSSTCAQCFGEGNIICDKIGCFNPDEHEQCCDGAGAFLFLTYLPPKKRMQFKGRFNV